MADHTRRPRRDVRRGGDVVGDEPVYLGLRDWAPRRWAGPARSAYIIYCKGGGAVSWSAERAGDRVYKEPVPRRVRSVYGAAAAKLPSDYVDVIAWAEQRKVGVWRKDKVGAAGDVWSVADPDPSRIALADGVGGCLRRGGCRCPGGGAVSRAGNLPGTRVGRRAGVRVDRAVGIADRPGCVIVGGAGGVDDLSTGQALPWYAPGHLLEFADPASVFACYPCRGRVTRLFVGGGRLMDHGFDSRHRLSEPYGGSWRKESGEGDLRSRLAKCLLRERRRRSMVRETPLPLTSSPSF
jgi:hypothetical protein